MDYEKAYKETIDKLRKLHNDWDSTQNRAAREIELVFPELCESEDERIRKMLYDIVFQWGNGNQAWNSNKDDVSKILSWLEKQGDNDKIVEKAKTEKQRVLLTETNGDAYIDWDCRSIDDVEKLLNCGLNFIHNTKENKQKIPGTRFGGCSVYIPTRYDKFEKQGEQKPIEQDTETHDLCVYIREWNDKFGRLPKDEDELASCIDYVMKRQKLADKVEPKFKIGDWVSKQYVSSPFVIVDIKDNLYILNDIEGNKYEETIDFAHDRYHLWTIQNAEDGDVLATLDYILIFKEFLKNNGGISYCHYDFRARNPQFIWSDDKNWYFGKEVIINPATKEQRDLLFAKMKEVGYEWDVEKKELKKIEQKPVDESEPKFKVGDWVRAISSSNIFKILSVNDGLYHVLCYDGVEANYPIEVEKDLEYWTIQDANDGDVLSYPDGTIVLFKYRLNGLNSGIYMSHILLATKIETCQSCAISKDLHPATKEQRDLLFQKMKEADYEWDAEKKELKKIEQKLVDKIEPKFNVGDWVMLDRPVLITKVEDMPYNTHQYWTSDGKWFGDATKAKLWTIQDAKDGDVLAEHETIVLFKKIEGQNIRCYCTYHYLGFNPTFYVGTLQNKNTYCPATKEQHDLLFQKMKETGYEWDAEKKELRTIENTSNMTEALRTEYEKGRADAIAEMKTIEWSEEDESILNGIMNYLCSHDSCELEGFGKWYDWLKSIKDRFQLQQKQEWSEEDNKNLNSVKRIIENSENLNRVFETIDSPEYIKKYFIDWIKSLKFRIDRSQWKPSEQNIKDLEWCADLVQDKMGVGFHRLQVFIDEIKKL